MTRLFLCLFLLAVSTAASAIVIRDDVDDAKYRIPISAFPALADMPGEGHGVLIAPQWIVTAAHAITWQHGGVKEVVLNGISRAVERVVIRPGYKKPPQETIAKALASGDAGPVIAVLASSDDIALLKLASPVADVKPIALYRGTDEAGKVVELVGKGATGTGARGHAADAPHRTELRRAYNTITSAQGRWLAYVFDKPPSGLALEGVTGDGDSGGPMLIQVAAEWRVAGLALWKAVKGDLRTFRSGVYGQTNYSVRLSHYLSWIDEALSDRTVQQGGGK